jgi:hypothetical protein
MGLFSGPLWCPFVKKRIHPFAEVPAHIAHEHEILAVLTRQVLAQPPQRLLGGAQCQRRVTGD